MFKGLTVYLNSVIHDRIVWLHPRILQVHSAEMLEMLTPTALSCSITNL